MRTIRYEFRPGGTEIARIEDSEDNSVEVWSRWGDTPIEFYDRMRFSARKTKFRFHNLEMG